MDITNSKYSSKLIVSAIFQSKLKRLLEEKWKTNLFDFIKSIKIEGNKIIIKTEKPIINAELKEFENEIKQLLDENMLIWNTEDIKIHYR